MLSPDTLVDGNWLAADTTGAPRFEYPFRMNGDIVSSLFEEDMWQTNETFLPEPFKTPHKKYNDYYLIAETKLQRVLANIITFTRTYARVPFPQSVPGSIWVTKPAIPGTFPQVLGSSLVMQPDATSASYQFYTRKIVTSDSGSPSGPNYPTGGTYTVTVGASTTAGIAYNATSATLQTALNALTSVSNRGSVVVTGTYNSVAGFTVTFVAEAAGSIDASLLTVAGGSLPIANIGVTTFDDGLTQQFNAGNYPASTNNINGGTFTATMFGQTTAALNYNDNLNTVSTAIKGLSKVGSAGTTVSQPGAGGWGPDPLESGHRAIRFYVALTRPVGSCDGSSLTPSGAGATCTLSTDVFHRGQFFLTFHGVAPTSRIISTATIAHGITSTDSIYLKQGSTYLTLTSSQYAIGDTYSIVFNPASGAAFTGSGTITEVGRLTSTYTAGSVLSRCHRVSTFYLPGVTLGITTDADIPLPALQSDPVSLMAAILAGTTSINYEVGELGQWRDSPILFRTVTTISAAGL